MAAVEAYARETDNSLFDEIIRAEKQDGRRIISENQQAIAFVPYFARFPYETYVVSKTADRSLLN